MQRPSISFVPVFLAAMGAIALYAIVQDMNVYTWGVVMASVTFAAAAYAALQEHRANRALSAARRRIGVIPHDELRRELDRARRHERPLAIARIELRDDLPVDDARAILAGLMGLRETRVVRSTDRAWRDRRSLYLLLPDTGRQEAEALLRRAFQADAAVDLELSRVVAFPRDGVTAGVLFELLGAALPAPDALITDADELLPEDPVSVPSEAGRDRGPRDLP